MAGRQPWRVLKWETSGRTCPFATAPAAPAAPCPLQSDTWVIRIRPVQVVTSCRATNTADDVHVPCAVHPTFLSNIKQFCTYFPVFSKAELSKALQVSVSLQPPLLALKMRLSHATMPIQRGTYLLLLEETARRTGDRVKT